MSKQISNTTVSFFSLRSRDLFWSLTLAGVVNLIALTLLSLGYHEQPHLTGPC